jgi:hypothetical protein
MIFLFLIAEPTTYLKAKITFFYLFDFMFVNLIVVQIDFQLILINHHFTQKAKTLRANNLIHSAHYCFSPFTIFLLICLNFNSGYFLIHINSIIIPFILITPIIKNFRTFMPILQDLKVCINF